MAGQEPISRRLLLSVAHHHYDGRRYKCRAADANILSRDATAAERAASYFHFRRCRRVNIDDAALTVSILAKAAGLTAA